MVFARLRTKFKFWRLIILSDNNNINIKPIKPLFAFLMFLIPGIWFYIILMIFIPAVTELTGISSYIVFLFLSTLLLNIPLFIFTVFLTKRDGYVTFKDMRERLRIKKISFIDVLWIVAGLIIAAALTGLIILVISLIFPSFDINSLDNISPIKAVPLDGSQRFFLLFFPVAFFFNFVGEEILWRGYILPRQIVSKYGKYAFIINALFHCVYHLAFGIAILVFIPLMLLMSYIAYKRENTTTAIIIHFLMGAPAEVLIALGIII